MQKMRHIILGGLLLLIATQVSFAQHKGPTAKPSSQNANKQMVSTQEMEKQVFEMVNDYRISKGLKPVKRAWEFDDIAREHSEQMARGEVGFSHANFAERVAAIKEYAHVPFKVSENLFEMKTSYPEKFAKEAFKGWLNSPGHKANMEKDYHQYTGVAVSRSANGTYYVTQIFAGKNPNPDPTKWKEPVKTSTKKHK